MQLQNLVDLVKNGQAAIEKKKLEEIADQYYLYKATGKVSGSGGFQSSLVSEIAAARKQIGDVLKEGTGKVQSEATSAVSSKDAERISKLEQENAAIRKELKSLHSLVETMSQKIDALAGGKSVGASSKPAALPATQPKPKANEAEDDDVDLFGSDEEQEDDEKARVREERLKAYADKKKAKPGPIAKSSVIMDVKPWDDETNMQEMEKVVRSVQMEGLVWGASKLVPLAYGIKKLQIMCVVEDEKVSVDELTEKIEAFDDYVQSVDIAAFNKI